MASLDNIYICNTDSVHYVEYINSSSKRTSQCNGWKNELLLFEVLRERRRDDVEEWEGLLSTLSSSQSEIRSVWPGMAFVIHWPGLHKGGLPSHSPTGVRQHRGDHLPSL